jgi:hypothetical protein
MFYLDDSRYNGELRRRGIVLILDSRYRRCDRLGDYSGDLLHFNASVMSITNLST